MFNQKNADYRAKLWPPRVNRETLPNRGDYWIDSAGTRQFKPLSNKPETLVFRCSKAYPLGRFERTDD